MSLFITSLSSGSNGNCYYVGNSDEAVLVDVGISCREVEKRLLRLNLDITRVKAIFISHEHTDHIFGLCGLAKKHQIAVYITAVTLSHSKLSLDASLVRSFIAHEPVVIGNLQVFAFPKYHDACDPHSFVIVGNNVTVGVFTDIGIACEQVVNYFKICQAVFLESNYDEQMLSTGGYPHFLKRRITGGRGHLSNSLAVDLFVKHRHNCLSHLILSHLSKNNNCPDLVANLFAGCAGTTKVIVAPRFSETPVFEIIHQGSAALPPRQIIPRFKPTLQPRQLTMF